MSASYSPVSINFLIFCTFSVAFKKFEAVYGRRCSNTIKRRYNFSKTKTNIIAYFSLHLLCSYLDSQIFLAFFFLQFFYLRLLLRFFNLLFLWRLLDFFFFHFFYFKAQMFLLKLWFAAFRICFIKGIDS